MFKGRSRDFILRYIRRTRTSFSHSCFAMPHSTTMPRDGFLENPRLLQLKTRSVYSAILFRS